MSKIKIACPECAAQYGAAESQMGKKTRCKKCNAVFVITRAEDMRSSEAAVPGVSRSQVSASDSEKDLPAQAEDFRRLREEERNVNEHDKEIVQAVRRSLKTFQDEEVFFWDRLGIHGGIIGLFSLFLTVCGAYLCYDGFVTPREPMVSILFVVVGLILLPAPVALFFETERERSANNERASLRSVDVFRENLATDPNRLRDAVRLLIKILEGSVEAKDFGFSDSIDDVGLIDIYSAVKLLMAELIAQGVVSGENAQQLRASLKHREEYLKRHAEAQRTQTSYVSDPEQFMKENAVAMSMLLAMTEEMDSEVNAAESSDESSAVTEIVAEGLGGPVSMRKGAQLLPGRARCPTCGHEFDRAKNTIAQPEKEEPKNDDEATTQVFVGMISERLQQAGHSMPHLQCPECHATWVENVPDD